MSWWTEMMEKLERRNERTFKLTKAGVRWLRGEKMVEVDRAEEMVARHHPAESTVLVEGPKPQSDEEWFVFTGETE